MLLDKCIYALSGCHFMNGWSVNRREPWVVDPQSPILVKAFSLKNSALRLSGWKLLESSVLIL